MSVIKNGVYTIFNLHNVEVIFKVINLDQGVVANPVQQINLRRAMSDTYFVCHVDQL